MCYNRVYTRDTAIGTPGVIESANKKTIEQLYSETSKRGNKNTKIQSNKKTIKNY